jgi:radical SAM/Cys-rich protein
MLAFAHALAEHGLQLTRGKTTALQVNVGLRCDRSCRHCHLEAGPERTEQMSPDVFEAVAAYAVRGRFEVIDLTGGAPELHPLLGPMLERFAALAPRVLLRTNLSALRGREDLIAEYRRHRVALLASFPSFNAGQADGQRGAGSLEAAVHMLRRLNTEGYGQPGAGLELDLVSNPTGAFLPEAQAATELRFRQVLAERFGIAFDRLFCFADVPLGRYRSWLAQSGNLETYLSKLRRAFNPATVPGLMCRSQVSVCWDGQLHDCDFNLALGLPLGGRRTHIGEVAGPPQVGSPISVADHCYACTAGTGFT